MYSNVDKSGSYAIRGFNYQNAVSVYLLILNYNDKNFFLIPEGEDDIVVSKSENYYYLQVKSNRMTKSSFINKGKNKDGTIKENVIEKLINKVSENQYTRYKIVCTSIADELINHKDPQKSNIFCCAKDQIYKLNTGKIGIDVTLPNIHIFMPGFKETNNDRSQYLLGTLVQNNVSVDNGRGRNILNTLKELVEHKSEIPLHNIQSYEDKKIKGSEINSLFVNDKKNLEMKGYYNDLIDSLIYPIEQKITMKIHYSGFSFIENDDEYIDLRRILKENNMLDKSHKFDNTYIDECRKILSREVKIQDSDKIDSKIIYCYLWEVLDYDN